MELEIDALDDVAVEKIARALCAAGRRRQQCESCGNGNRAERAGEERMTCLISKNQL